jgi:hypothetical protein
LIQHSSRKVNTVFPVFKCPQNALNTKPVSPLFLKYKNLKDCETFHNYGKVYKVSCNCISMSPDIFSALLDGKMQDYGH